MLIKHEIKLTNEKPIAPKMYWIMEGLKDKVHEYITFFSSIHLLRGQEFLIDPASTWRVIIVVLLHAEKLLVAIGMCLFVTVSAWLIIMLTGAPCVAADNHIW